MKKTKKIVTIIDLGGGDGGKGGVVHGVCKRMGAHTVLKVGGAQGSHGVRTSHGQQFNFSQFGCGTFDGVRTHITPRMVISPIGLLAEGNSLRYAHGVRDAFSMLTVEEACLCATPYHGIASRIAELARKDNPKGTVGVGVGEAYNDSLLRPDLAIYARDLSSLDVREKLAAIRAYQRQKLEPVLAQAETVLDADRELLVEDIAKLNDDHFLTWVAEQFALLNRELDVVDAEYVSKTLMNRDGVMVVESSHGVLTDRYYGFHPYVSRLRTLPRFNDELIAQYGYSGEVVRLGVTRAYQIRHGAGPLVTNNPILREQLLPGSSKDANRWQGEVRVGALDFVALRYAVSACGGPASFDGIALTWFDQIQRVGAWETCNRYAGATNSQYFDKQGDIVLRHGEDEARLNHQAELAKQLFECSPICETRELPEFQGVHALGRLCSDVFEEHVGVPVRMLSIGSTELEKVYV